MACKTYRLRATGTASSDGLATINFTRPGNIKAVVWNIQQVTSVAANSVTFELATNSTRQQAANDAPGILSTCAHGASSSAAGGSVPATNFFQACDLPVKAGDRLFLHSYYEAGNETVRPLVSVLVQE